MRREMQCNWSETHPVAHALVVAAAAMALAGIVETFIEAIAGGVAAMVVYGSVDRAYMGNMGLISTVITMVSHIVVLLLYWFIFRKDLQGFFNARRFGEFVLLGWSVLAIGAFNLISEILEHESYGNPGVALLMGMQPGICEEIMLRVIPISLVMRSKERERLVIPVVVFTSLLFGLWHGFNILSGANPVTTLFQVIYATGVGFLFAAIYLRTGDIWITMFLHAITDTIYFLGAEAQSGDAILSQSTSFSDAIILLAYAVLYFANAFYVFRKSKRIEISDTWSRIWKVKTES